MDCGDSSDEENCNFIHLPSIYAPEIPPKPNASTPARVKVGLGIQDLPSIDTFNQRFTADFTLGLEWVDPRITFMNINDQDYWNTLSQKSKEGIWMPKIMFQNALGDFSTTHDDLAGSVMVLKRGNGTVSPDTQAHEGKR